MKQQKQDPDLDLELRLADYRIADLAASERQALLDKIMDAAPVPTAPAPTRPSVTLRGWRKGWTLDAAAFAAVALLGFWVGTAPSQTVLLSGTAQTMASTSQGYMNEIVFGPTSWKEVSL
ncbi:MAG: hypothetical protein PHE27_07990 [Alphaproteobacteria bacterium]|nr:hypothetical protein [Alphaproteobacteria bacterium]